MCSSEWQMHEHKKTKDWFIHALFCSLTHDWIFSTKKKKKAKKKVIPKIDFLFSICTRSCINLSEKYKIKAINTKKSSLEVQDSAISRVTQTNRPTGTESCSDRSLVPSLMFGSGGNSSTFFSLRTKFLDLPHQHLASIYFTEAG